MRALAALFAEHADFVDVAGQWFKGSAAIQTVLTARHATVFKASRFIEAGRVGPLPATGYRGGPRNLGAHRSARSRRSDPATRTKDHDQGDEEDRRWLGNWSRSRTPWSSHPHLPRMDERKHLCAQKSEVFMWATNHPHPGRSGAEAIPPRDVALPTSWRTGSTGWCPQRGRWCQRWRRSRARTA